MITIKNKNIAAAKGSKSTAKAAPAKSNEITPEEFVLKAIPIIAAAQPLYKGEKAKGIHTVFAKVNGANFNEMFRAKFFGLNPVDVTAKMKEANQIAIKPVRGGVMLFLASDYRQAVTESAEERGKKALAALGL